MNQTVWRKSCYCAGGSRVRKIQEDSKSEILISKRTRKDKGRIVTITGTMQQIQTAKILLKNALESDKCNRNSRNDPCNMKSNLKNWKIQCQIFLDK